MEKDDYKPSATDLCLLIQKFISYLPLRKTLQVFNEELKENKIIPKHTNWKTSEHVTVIEEILDHYPNIRPYHLLQLHYPGTEKSGLELYNKGNLASILYLPRNVDVNKSNFRQFFNVVVKRHGAPIQEVAASCNIVNSIRGREVSGPISRFRTISSVLYRAMKLQSVRKAHESRVSCLIFDRSGKYIITGSDDCLVKVWSVRSSTLRNTLGKAFGSILDLAINRENSLVAATSTDTLVRIWELKTGSPVTTYITCLQMLVNFSPVPRQDLWLIMHSSSMGSVTHAVYRYDSKGTPEFIQKPSFSPPSERSQAVKMSSCFSPCGVYFAMGTQNSMVCMLLVENPKDPRIILEVKAHNGPVNCIEWAHSGLRFLSGGQDGVVIVWQFKGHQWTATRLSTPDYRWRNDVMIACWTKSDDYIVSIGSNNRLNVWKAADGHLEKVLSHHRKTINSLRAHPHDNNVIVSSEYDKLIVCDIKKGEMLYRYIHITEKLQLGRISTLGWSPDGYGLAAADQEGRLIVFRLETKMASKIPD